MPLEDVLAGLSNEQLEAVRRVLKRVAKEEMTAELLSWRSRRGLKFPPLTCARCNTKTFLGPLCFEHMEAGRSMATMWRDYVDPRRRDIARVEAFILAAVEKAEPGEGLKRASSQAVEEEANAILDNSLVG